MIGLTVNREEALIAFDRVPHQNFQRAIAKYWNVDDDGVHVYSQSVCWLFCWAKADDFHEDSAHEARAVFNQLLTVSFRDFDRAVDLETAQKYRRPRKNRAPVESDIDRRLAEAGYRAQPT